MGDGKRAARPKSAPQPGAGTQSGVFAGHHAVVLRARDLDVPVVSGRFRARMQVELVNFGPVTLLLDTKRVF